MIRFLLSIFFIFFAYISQCRAEDVPRRYISEIQQLSNNTLIQERYNLINHIQTYERKLKGANDAFSTATLRGEIKHCKKLLTAVNREISRRGGIQNIQDAKQPTSHQRGEIYSNFKNKSKAGADAAYSQSEINRERIYQQEIQRTQPFYNQLSENAAYYASQEGLSIASNAVNPNKYMNPGSVNYIPSSAPRISGSARRSLIGRMQQIHNAQDTENEENEENEEYIEHHDILTLEYLEYLVDKLWNAYWTNKFKEVVKECMQETLKRVQNKLIGMTPGYVKRPLEAGNLLKKMVKDGLIEPKLWEEIINADTPAKVDRVLDKLAKKHIKMQENLGVYTSKESAENWAKNALTGWASEQAEEGTKNKLTELLLNKGKP